MNISFTSACSGAMTSWTPIDEFTNMYRRFANGNYEISTFDGNVSTTLYQGPNVSEAITAWYSALGVKVIVMYHRGDTLYPVPEPNTTCLWMIPTTRPVTKNSSSPVAGDVLGIEGKNYQVVEIALSGAKYNFA